MTKGDETRSVILRQALDLSSEVGLEGLTVGALAKQVGMSKSGLYAHFESKEDLQSQVLDAAAALFVDVVVSKALTRPRGLPRVEALFQNWLGWTTEKLSGGCPFIAAATEYDDRPGPVRDTLVGHLLDVIGTIARAAQISVDEGHFRADLDVDQFAFEFWAILLAYHHFCRLMRQDDARKRAKRAFAALIRNAGAEL
jgi:AcrR family transcriptional regulator